ncbi:hypothetical protein Tco_0537269 [Tanacetum coccineum]
MVDHVGSSSKSNSKAKGKGKKKNDKKCKSKAEYIAPKVRIANMVNDNMDMIAIVFDVISMISEVNLVERLTMERSCTLATLQLMISRAKEMGYAVNGMFKLNVMVVKNDINKMNSSTYLIESSNVWHGRLGHNSNAYRFIIHDLKNPDIQKNVVMESRNASFLENIFPCLTKETRSSSRLDDEVVQDKRQRDDNDLHDERQDQLEEE